MFAKHRERKQRERANVIRNESARRWNNQQIVEQAAAGKRVQIWMNPITGDIEGRA